MIIEIINKKEQSHDVRNILISDNRVLYVMIYDNGFRKKEDSFQLCLYHKKKIKPKTTVEHIELNAQCIFEKISVYLQDKNDIQMEIKKEFDIKMNLNYQ